MPRAKFAVITATALAVFGLCADARADTKDKAADPEISVAVHAATGLRQAVTAAEAKSGGRAIEASIEGETGNVVYLVRTAARDGINKVLVDPTRGTVLKVGKPGFFERLFDDDRDQAASLGAGVTLTSAIQAAETKTGGKAIEAEVDDDAGIRVEVAKGGSVQCALVDAKTGHVTSLENRADDKDESNDETKD